MCLIKKLNKNDTIDNENDIFIIFGNISIVD